MLAKLQLVAEPDSRLKAAQRTVKALNDDDPDWLQTGRINLKLVDDAGIRALNKQYSGQDKATDVLSFSYLETGEPTDGELGDIAISHGMAERQAQAAGNSLEDELALLTLHGILHVHGFDHVTADDRRKMDQIQADILARAKVAYRDFKWET